MEEILKELKEIKEKLHAIESSLEQETKVDIEIISKDLTQLINSEIKFKGFYPIDCLEQSINKIPKEIEQWLKGKGAVDIENFKFLIPNTQHMFSLNYLESNSLETIKKEYKSLYPNL